MGTPIVKKEEEDKPIQKAKLDDFDSDDDEEEGFTRNKVLGEGTYAVVYQGSQISTGRTVAIKKIKVREMIDGIDMSAIREIKTLKELHHPNIIELIEVYMHKESLNLILEYLDADLEQIIKDKTLVFMPADIKSWMLMTLRGVEHCHKNYILHRDLKPNNLLLRADGQLKLADFGLAREFGDPDPMTHEVVTRWYRSPELYYGAKHYSEGVDMWAVGTIFAELMLRTPFLAGESDSTQLDTIFKALGTPTEDDWPGITKLPLYIQWATYVKTPLRAIFTAASEDALDLLDSMLQFDPSKRISASDAIKHSYFMVAPHPTTPSKLPKYNKPKPEETDKRTNSEDNGADETEPKKVKVEA